MIHNKAVNIFEDYIIEDCNWNLRTYPLTQQERRRSIKGGGSDGQITSIVQEGNGLDESLTLNSIYPFPLEILRELRVGYSQKKIRFVINNGLFSDLYIYSLERLRGWYDDFT